MAGYWHPKVYVVHCVDTEGPIGGDVRRNPDGSKEFMDNWNDIKTSLHEITNKEFRHAYERQDSFGNPYIYNWFIMDFMGFKTNPKNRIQEYNDTYDNIKSLETKLDSFHWHYHHPPKSGIGDQWSDDWGSSRAWDQILGHRIIHRQDFPEVFRAGGTIEDEKCSSWLEDNLMIDYSNRSYKNSKPTSNIFDFNWYGAPTQWGYYHPNRHKLTEVGDMRRYIVRSVDLRSRIYELSFDDVLDAFKTAQHSESPVILSYFSHDHRDMRDETKHATELIKRASSECQIPFCWSDAKEALQATAGLKPIDLNVSVANWKESYGQIRFRFNHPIYQTSPFVYTLDDKGVINRIFASDAYEEYDGLTVGFGEPWVVCIDDSIKKVGIAATSLSGDKCVKVIDV